MKHEARNQVRWRALFELLYQFRREFGGVGRRVGWSWRGQRMRGVKPIRGSRFWHNRLPRVYACSGTNNNGQAQAGDDEACY